MLDRWLGALVLVFAACAFGCGRKPGRDKAIPPAKDSGIALPSLDGLKLTKVGSPDDGPAGAEKWLRKVTVDVPAEGEPTVAGFVMASKWRGIVLPKDEGQGPVASLDESRLLRVTLAEDGGIRVDGRDCPNAGEFSSLLADLPRTHPRRDMVVLDPHGSVAFGHVMRALAVVLERGVDFRFQAPDFEAPGWHVPELRARLIQEAKLATKKIGARPEVCLRIRADAGVPYKRVQATMISGLGWGFLRLSFVGLLDGREVEIGITYTSRDHSLWDCDGNQFVHKKGTGGRPQRPDPR